MLHRRIMPRPASTVQALTSIPRLNVLGVGVSAINMPVAVAQIDGWIQEGHCDYICVRDIHGIVASRKSEQLRRIHNRAGLVTPDGMPLVWLLKWAGYRNVDRVCGRDLMAAVLVHGALHGWRHFLYGSKPETLSLLEANLKRLVPNAEIVGSFSPPFRECTPEEDAEIVARINASQAEIVWVGLSTPKQELWMAAHREQLHANALVGVGAAFDFHAGTVRAAPAFLQRIGLEWLYRLAQEPRRLWPRYGTGIPLFIWGVLLQATRLRRYPIDPVR